MQRIDPKQIEALVAANRESLEPLAVPPAPVAEPHSPQRHAQHQQATTPSPQPSDGATGRSTRLAKDAAKSLVIPRRGGQRRRILAGHRH